MSPHASQETSAADAIEKALDALRSGGFVVVADARERENEADLILAAQFAGAAQLAFLIRHSSGIVCAPMSQERADRLGLPAMVSHNTDPHRTAFTVSVDAAIGTSTGISASDRARTLRALASEDAAPNDFVRPGHVFPLRADPGGLAARAGHTEASVELMRMAGLVPVAVISELVGDDGNVLSGEALDAFIAAHDLPRLDVAQIADVGLATAPPEEREAARVRRLASAPLPTRYGNFSAELLRTEPDGLEHLVLTCGNQSAEPVLVRIHSECATGDLFGSRRCDCGEQLDAAMRAIGSAGSGILVYERGHEGRGIGLADKLRAYRLQDAGADTVDANLWLGRPADARDFRPAARVLSQLGVSRICLLTNNPNKVAALRELGLEVEMRPLRTTPRPDNVRYLETKRIRFGHDLPAAQGAVPR